MKSVSKNMGPSLKPALRVSAFGAIEGRELAAMDGMGRRELYAGSEAEQKKMKPA